jgi:uncharacterized membrane protein
MTVLFCVFFFIRFLKFLFCVFLKSLNLTLNKINEWKNALKTHKTKKQQFSETDKKKHAKQNCHYNYF